MKRLLSMLMALIVSASAAPLGSIYLTVSAQEGGVLQSAIPEEDFYPEEFYWDKAGEDADNGYKAFSVKLGAPLQIPDKPFREGMTFVGWKDWYTDELVDLANETMNSTKGRRFYAAWSNTFYFYADGVLLTKTESIVGESFVVPRSPFRDGYAFAGWSPKLPHITPAESMSFYAQFTPEQYIATLMVDGKVYKEIPYTYGQKSISLPDVPEKEGYTGKWENYSLGIGGVTIHAIYTPNTYIATLTVDGEVYKEIPYTYGQKSISLPDVPEKEGYTGKWESYSLGIGGVKIQAVYTPVRTLHSVTVSDLKLNYKSSARLNAKIDADDGLSYTVDYKSSDPTVARVGSNGTVYGAGFGSAEITMTVTCSDGTVMQDTCTVNVKYTLGQWALVIFLFGWIWY